MYTASKGMQREREDLTGRLINPKLCNDNNTTIHFSHVSGVLIFKYRFTLIKQLAKFPFLYTHNLSSHMTTKKQKNYRIMFKSFLFQHKKFLLSFTPHSGYTTCTHNHQNAFIGSISSLRCWLPDMVWQYSKVGGLQCCVSCNFFLPFFHCFHLRHDFWAVHWLHLRPFTLFLIQPLRTIPPQTRLGKFGRADSSGAQVSRVFVDGNMLPLSWFCANLYFANAVCNKGQGVSPSSSDPP